MELSYLILTLLAVSAAGVAGGSVGWIGALVAAPLARWERRIPVLGRLCQNGPQAALR